MKNHTLRVFIAVSMLLCLVGLPLLSSCHGKVVINEFVVPESFDESRNYEITFWAKNDTNKAQVRVYDNAVKEFHELYPNITVNIKYYTDYNTIYQDVITNISTKTTPNVCITYPDHIATYITGEGTVVPLGSLADNEKYGLGGSELKFEGIKKDEIVTDFLSECYLGETLYALPFMRSTEALYINKTYVEALGYEVPDIVTWDFIWEVSDKAAEKDENGLFKINQQNVMIPFIYKSSDNMMIQYLKQAGAGYSNDDGDVEIFNETTKNFLRRISSHVQSGAFSTFKVSGYPGNFMNAGQCIFAIDSTAGATWIGPDAPLSEIAEDLAVDFELVLRPVPQIDAENPKMISQGPSICVFNKDDTQEVLASWLFAQYLLTDNTQIEYGKTEGYVPVTSKAQNSDSYKDYLNSSGIDNDEHYFVKIDAAKLLLDNLDNTFVTPVFNGSTSLRTASGEMIDNVVKSTRRKETIDETYLTTMFDDLTIRYHLDEIGSNNGEKDLGTLPKTAVILIIVFIGIWVVLGTFLIIKKVKKKKQ